MYKIKNIILHHFNVGSDEYPRHALKSIYLPSIILESLKINNETLIESSTFQIVITSMFQDEFCIIYYSGDELEHHIFKPNRLLFLMYKDESSPPFNPEKILKFLSENRIPEMFFFELTQISATKLTQKYFTLLSELDCIEKVSALQTKIAKFSSVTRDLFYSDSTSYPIEEIHWESGWEKIEEKYKIEEEEAKRPFDQPVVMTPHGPVSVPEDHPLSHLGTILEKLKGSEEFNRITGNIVERASLEFFGKKDPVLLCAGAAYIGFLLTCEEKFNTSYYRSKEQKRIAQICNITKSDVIDAFIELNQRLSLGL